MCCKRKSRASRRNLRDPNADKTTKDPIGGHMKEYPPAPTVESKNSKNGKYAVSVLQPDDSLVIPIKGMPISRVFVGIGWKASTKVDVDCVCAPYSNGVRAETDTVGFFN